MRRKRAKLTPDERAAAKAQNAAHMRKTRHKQSQTSTTSSAKTRTAATARQRAHRDKLSAAKRAADNAASALHKRQKRREATAEQLAEQRRSDAARKRLSRSKRAPTTTDTAADALAQVRGLVAPPVRPIRDRSPTRDLKDAALFRDVMDELSPDHVCAVCGCRNTVRDVEYFAMCNIPNLHLLAVGGHRTGEFPRDELTRYEADTGNVYCMTDAGEA